MRPPILPAPLQQLALHPLAQPPPPDLQSGALLIVVYAE